jgi:ATP-binding cassette subfamily B protein
MRKDADILVLDEPTASMDAEAEVAIFDRFRERTQDQIAIVISHRFSTVRMADSIVVLDGGRILERGSHDELVAAGGRYATLFALQARGYDDRRWRTESRRSSSAAPSGASVTCP